MSDLQHSIKGTRLLNKSLEKHLMKLQEVALKITKGNKANADDLTQDLIVVILEYDREKMLSIVNNGHLVFWSARVLMNQYTRSNSTFKTKYYTALRSENKDIKNFKYEDEIDDKIEFDHKLEFIEKKLKNLHQYDQLLFKTYYQSGKSIRQLAKETDISVTSIFTTLRNVKKYLKNEVDHEFKELER